MYLTSKCSEFAVPTEAAALILGVDEEGFKII